ncbi:putative peptidoglycan glycosyltransferase FtsW [Brevibacterium sp.]|uniref:FtsW/RodA/SpoVE family cell cycle protein n=1 Tax=Brevibacterium sp. TaxID=1701 RepID=UPI0025C6FB1F|nr:putative peptidoglycan glycosyltransferase FtsW [Brevibacterium sp.]
MRERTAAGGGSAPERVGPLTGLRRALANPAANYVLIVASVLALTGFGLLMVLSASSITAYQGGAGSSYAIFARQALFALAGLVLAFGLSRVPGGWWRPLAWFAFPAALGLQSLVLTPLARAEGGNQNWVALGPAIVQPSEFLKVAFALWLAAVLSRPGARERPWSTWGLSLLGFGAAGGLIMAGGDLGTAIIVFALYLGALFVADLPVMATVGTCVAGAGAAALLVVTNANRMQRVAAMMAGHAEAGSDDYLSSHWQSAHGTYALASGGWFGVGLGASREKWAWLPEAHNDFIFAIIGEELGLLGSLIVIALFVVLAAGLLRMALRTPHAQVRVLVAAVFMWLIGQATVNIAVVATLLPVIGVPLPFVSAGGSSLVANLIMIGVVLSFARDEPGVAEALRLRGRRVPEAARTSSSSRTSKETTAP